MRRHNFALFLTGFIVSIILGGVSPPLSHSSVEVVYQTDDVDTIKVDNPHVSGVNSNSYIKLIFPTEGALTVGTQFQVVVHNGASNSQINDVRFATATPMIVNPTNYITALNSGVNLRQTTSDSVWDGGPNNTGFGFSLNTAAAVTSGTDKTFTFQVTSGPGTLTYQDFTSGLQPAKGTADHDLDSYASLKWKQNTSMTGPNGEAIPADALFSQRSGSLIINTNTPVDKVFNAVGITAGTSGIAETAVPVYGAISQKTVSTEGVGNTTMRVTKTESFTSIPAGMNTVGLIVDFKDAAMRQMLADKITMAGSVTEVMVFSLKVGAGSLNQLTYGTEWDFGYDGLSNPNRLFAYLVPGTYGTLPIFTGSNYYFQLDFLNYSDTFGTVVTGDIVSNIYGNAGIAGGGVVPEIPQAAVLPIALMLGAVLFWIRRRALFCLGISAN